MRIAVRASRAVMFGALLATQATTPASCGTPAEDCGFVFHGPYVADGKVRDSILVSCEVPPRKHVLDAYMERENGYEWDEAPGGRHALTSDIPDKQGFSAPVSSGDCRAGWYRAVAHVSGEGPSLPDGTPGATFDYSEAGPELHITDQDCGGGS